MNIFVTDIPQPAAQALFSEPAAVKQSAAGKKDGKQQRAPKSSVDSAQQNVDKKSPKPRAPLQAPPTTTEYVAAASLAKTFFDCSGARSTFRESNAVRSSHLSLEAQLNREAYAFGITSF